MFEEPDNVDYIFGYAQVLHWSGADTEALRFLGIARELAADYEDVWILEADVRRRLGTAIAVEDRAEFERSARQRFGDADWLVPLEDIRDWRLRWVLAANRQRLDTDASDWRQEQLTVELALRSGFSLAVVGLRSERFAAADRQAGGAVGFEFADRWSARAGYLGSPSATHLPEAETWLDVAGKFGTGWVANARLRKREYGDSVVHLASLAVDRYSGPYRLEYALGVASLDSERATSHRIAIERYLESGAALGVIAARGEEIEVAGPGDLRRLDTRSAVLTSKWPLGAGLTLACNLGVHDYRDLYRRIEFGVAVAGAF